MPVTTDGDIDYDDKWYFYALQEGLDGGAIFGDFSAIS